MARRGWRGSLGEGNVSRRKRFPRESNTPIERTRMRSTLLTQINNLASSEISWLRQAPRCCCRSTSIPGRIVMTRSKGNCISSDCVNAARPRLWSARSLERSATRLHGIHRCPKMRAETRTLVVTFARSINRAQPQGKSRITSEN